MVMGGLVVSGGGTIDDSTTDSTTDDSTTDSTTDESTTYTPEDTTGTASGGIADVGLTSSTGGGGGDVAANDPTMTVEGSEDQAEVIEDVQGEGDVVGETVEQTAMREFETDLTAAGNIDNQGGDATTLSEEQREENREWLRDWYDGDLGSDLSMESVGLDGLSDAQIAAIAGVALLGLVAVGGD